MITLLYLYYISIYLIIIHFYNAYSICGTVTPTQLYGKANEPLYSLDKIRTKRSFQFQLTFLI